MGHQRGRYGLNFGGARPNLSWIFGGAKHTILPIFAPSSKQNLKYWRGSCPPCPPYNAPTVGHKHIFKIEPTLVMCIVLPIIILIFKGPATQAQLVMLRGLTESWCFPFLVDFNFKIDVKEFTELICVAAELDFPILISVCDQGGANDGLRGRLNITDEKPFCEIKVSDEKSQEVIFIHDWIHLFKERKYLENL